MWGWDGRDEASILPRFQGYAINQFLAHGLRRGLHSYAASRLLQAMSVRFFGRSRVATPAQRPVLHFAHPK